MVAQRSGEKFISIGIECRLRILANVDIVEEVYRSKICQRLAYPESIWFSWYKFNERSLQTDAFQEPGACYNCLIVLEPDQLPQNF